MKTRLSIIAAGAVLALSACGGGGGTAAPATQNTTTTTTPPASDPVKWAGAFCGGVTPVMVSLFEFLKTALAAGDNPAAFQAGMVKTLETGSKSLGEAEQKLKDLGAPGPEAKELHDEIVKLFGTNAKEYASVAEQAKKLDPNAPDFMDQVDKIGGDQADPEKLSAAIKKIENDPKYKDAMAKAPECVEMKTKLAGALGK